MGYRQKQMVAWSSAALLALTNLSLVGWIFKDTIWSTLYTAGSQVTQKEINVSILS